MFGSVWAAPTLPHRKENLQSECAVLFRRWRVYKNWLEWFHTGKMHYQVEFMCLIDQTFNLLQCFSLYAVLNSRDVRTDWACNPITPIQYLHFPDCKILTNIHCESRLFSNTHWLKEMYGKIQFSIPKWFISIGIYKVTQDQNTHLAL